MTARIVACGIVLLIALSAAAALDARANAEAFVALLAVASIAYLTALHAIARQPPSLDAPPLIRPTPPRAGVPGVSRSLLFCLALAVIWRIVFLAASPLVSDDVYRYIWDGRVQQIGVSPYAIAPADPTGALFHTEATRRIDPASAVLPSVYPPLAQRFFLLVTLVDDSAFAMTLAVLLCDLLVIALLWHWFTAAGRSRWWVLAYAWHPLVALEGAGGAHVDLLGALLLVAAAYALAWRRSLLAAVALAGAIAVKFLPVVLLPIFWRRIRLMDAAAGAAVILLLYLPFIAPTGDWLPVGSLGTYIAQWRFNGPPFRWLEAGIGARGAVVVAVAAGLGVAAYLRRTRPTYDPAAWAWPLAATLSLMPAIYPWYLVWLVPFLVRPAASPPVIWPLGVWTLASTATYVVWTPFLAGEGWILPAWVELAEYGCVAAAALWVWRRRAAATGGTDRRPFPWGRG